MVKNVLKNRKVWIALLAAVVLSLLLEVVQIHTQVPDYTLAATEEMTAGETVLWPDGGRIAEVKGYVQNGSELRWEEINIEAWLQFDTAGLGEISTLSLYFAEPAASQQFTVYYTKDGEYSEAYKAYNVCPEGVTYWAVSFTPGEYTGVRLRFHAMDISVNSIAIGNTPPERIFLPGRMHPLRIAVVAFILAAVFLWCLWIRALPRFRAALRSGFSAIRQEKGRAVLKALLFPALIGLSILAARFLTGISNLPFLWPTVLFAAGVGFCAACLLVFRKTLGQAPEYLFLCLVLCLGFLFSYLVPHSGLGSWDEGYHYMQAVKSSYVDERRFTMQEYAIVNMDVSASYDTSKLEGIYAAQDALYHSGAISVPDHTPLSSIPELFNGIGLFLGRALGLPYYLIQTLARFCGLLAYAFAGFFGIRRLKSNKMIAALILLLPTSVFLASSFNYDSYLTSFTLLGLCYYISLWQEPEARLTLKDAIIMIGAVSFGCLTKVLYMPLLWLMAFLPKKKFLSGKARLWYLAGIAGATVLLILSYIVPLIRNPSRSTGMDTQTSWILAHPLEYARLLIDYLINHYLNPVRSGELVTNMAYYGKGKNPYTYLILMAIAIVTDRNRHDRYLLEKPWTARVLPIAVSLGTMMLVITSMYIVFNPIGNDHIEGAQFRYMIPLLFPLLLPLGSPRIENHMNRSWYNGLILAVAAFMNFSVMFDVFVSHYF